MTFVLKDAGAGSEELAGWPLPPTRNFVRSRAYLRLYRALRRYIDQDIPGRSFLIAGHRGTGKTALVTRAIDDLRTERLRDSVKESGSFTGTRSAMQRPLFVKLHGPSLLEAVLAEDRPKETQVGPAEGRPEEGGQKPPENPPKPAETPAEGRPEEGGQKPPENPPKSAEMPGAPPAKASPSQSYVALIQITLALYRALAEEISTGFAAHARMLTARGREANDYLEIAAQLTLELDSAPHPAVLRRYWNMLGRLSGQGRGSGFGILWPRTADPTLRHMGRHDQAFREIIAVATAAQAFRVTAGKTTDSVDRTEQDKHEATLSARTANLNSLFDRGGALLAGALAGGAAVLNQTPPTGAVGLGLVTALLTGLVLSWTSTRTQKREQILKYTFIRRHDEGTLERDLPTVIRRIREAGLAPIFVLDELDKLTNPTKRIREIIKRLKHLVTDHGFFCFLTDRNYFDETERRIEEGPYPIEHTFFSERLLILYSSAEFLRFLRDTIDIDPPTPENGFARLLLSLSLMHEAKLNFADVTRAIARLVGENGTLRLSAEDVRRQPRYQHRAMMQLAVDEILRGPILADRLETDPGFAQLAVDALYIVSRWWEQDKKEIDLTSNDDPEKDALRKYLNARLRGCPTDEAEGSVEKVEVDPVDLELLRGEVGKLCGLLHNLKSLRERIMARTDLPVPNPQDVIPESLDRLVGKVSRQKWSFLFQSTGAPQVASAEMLDAARAKAERLGAFVRAVDALWKVSGLEVPHLVGAGVLPPSVTWPHVLEAAGAALSPDDEPDPHVLVLLQEFESIFSNRLGVIRETILLVDMLRRSVSPLPAAPDVLARLTRYLDFAAAAAIEHSPGLLAAAGVGSEAPPLAADAASVEALTRWLQGPEAANAIIHSETGEDLGWALWRDRLRPYLDKRSEPVLVHTGELLLAAAGTPAGTWLRLPLDRMTVGEWSLLAVRAMDQPGAPIWLGPAALRALGFGQPLLARLRDWLKTRDVSLQWFPDDESTLNEVIGGVGERPPGLLHVAARAGAILDGSPGRHPVLGLLGKDCEEFQSELFALYEMQAFKATTDEPF